jgi:hypothetical protein
VVNQIALKLEIETLCVAQFWMNQIKVNRCGRISIYLKTWNERIAKVLVDQNKMEEYWGAD